MRTLSLLILLFTSAAHAAEPVSAPTEAVVIYQTETEFDDVKFNLDLAISGKGLKVSNTLHISNMLTRTQKETQMPDHPYGEAESLEFCSSVITHLMSQAHPANMSSCPLTISIYSLKNSPDKTYLAYQRPKMLGDSHKAELALTQLLDEIIQETLE